jgi:alcohol dehydrogenase class IV
MQDFESPTECIIAFTAVPMKFGFGAADEAGYEAKRLDAKKVLICTDKNLRKTGHPDRIKEIVEKEDIGVEVYDNIHVEPTDRSFDRMADDLKGMDFDLYIAVGGGSVIDTTKAANLLITYPAPIIEYINQPIGSARPVPGPIKPTLAIPTTSGTGSETTPVTVLDLPDLRVKTGISHPYLRPTMALIDPLLTVSVPPEVTAFTGTDVLTHALESYTTMPYDKRKKPDHPSQRVPYIGANMITDLWCEKAIEIVGTYLRRAVANPYDLEARWYMAAGSTFAGIGFGNSGVHIPHAMGYPIAGMIRDYRPPGYNADHPMAPHGLSVTATAPAAFRFTAPIWPEKHAYAAHLLGVDIDCMSEMEAALSLPDAIIELMKDIGFPNGLEELGYTQEDIPALVEGSMKQQRLLVGCPRPVGEKELTQITRESMRYW